MVSPGQYIKDNVPVVTLVKAHPLRLRVDIPEVAVAAVRPGTTLEFTAEAVPGHVFRAIVRELNPALDARSRSLSAEARLAAAYPALRPGMFVQVRLVVSQEAEVLMVPEASLLTIAGLTKMFTIRDGKTVELRVTPGVKQNGWIEVTGAEIRAGDPVITSSISNLVSGLPVAVRKG
jgi:membrane fusion protein (multidrug efflux system)